MWLFTFLQKCRVELRFTLEPDNRQETKAYPGFCSMLDGILVHRWLPPPPFLLPRTQKSRNKNVWRYPWAVFLDAIFILDYVFIQKEIGHECTSSYQGTDSAFLFPVFSETRRSLPDFRFCHFAKQSQNTLNFCQKFERLKIKWITDLNFFFQYFFLFINFFIFFGVGMNDVFRRPFLATNVICCLSCDCMNFFLVAFRAKSLETSKWFYIRTFRAGNEFSNKITSPVQKATSLTLWRTAELM